MKELTGYSNDSNARFENFLGKEIAGWYLFSRDLMDTPKESRHIKIEYTVQDIFFTWQHRIKNQMGQAIKDHYGI